MPPIETDQGTAGQSGHASVLTRSDFSGAIRDALRSYVQTDLLAGNALLEAQVVARGTPGTATPQALKALLAETAESLFAGGRDQKVYRGLQLTYFDPAPQQEAAAGRRGLPFTTYRRHLAGGIERLTEWLWQQEQELQQPEDPATHTPEPASEAPTAVPGPR